MGQETKIEVINKFGWGKEFALDKPLVQIGRDAHNDIVLDDGHDSGIAPRHAQLLPSSVNRQGVRLVNLSNSDIVVVARSTPENGAGVTVPPRGGSRNCQRRSYQDG